MKDGYTAVRREFDKNKLIVKESYFVADKSAKDKNKKEDKNTEKHKYSYKIKIDDIDPPLKKNDNVGKLMVYEKDNR